MRLAGKRALVTGAASGFGAAIAERFCAEGASVVVADLNAAQGEAVAARLAAAHDGRCAAVRCDVSREADVAAAVQVALARFGGLDVVVNNAGTTHRTQPASEVPEADFDRLWQVNVKSLFWMHRHATPAMRAAGAGAYVNVASATGVRPGPGLTWYGGTKAAIINLTRGLAQELARERIRVNAINPMIGETAMLESFMGMPDTPENRQRFLARIPLGRFTRPDDVAHAAVYLASDESAFLTGVALDVDGGRSL